LSGQWSTKSPETKDELTAIKKAAQAVEELRIQAGVMSNGSYVQSMWDVEGEEWTIPIPSDGSNDEANATGKTVNSGEMTANDDLIKQADLQYLPK